jgi:hypothetical protein
MQCFSLAWIEQMLVWLVIIAAIIGILQIIVPWVLSKLGPQLGEAVGIVSAVIRIIVWAFVIIVVIYIVFGLISCLLGAGGGLHLPGR